MFLKHIQAFLNKFSHLLLGYEKYLIAYGSVDNILGNIWSNYLYYYTSRYYIRAMIANQLSVIKFSIEVQIRLWYKNRIKLLFFWQSSNFTLYCSTSFRALIVFSNL